MVHEPAADPKADTYSKTFGEREFIACESAAEVEALSKSFSEEARVSKPGAITTSAAAGANYEYEGSIRQLQNKYGLL